MLQNKGKYGKPLKYRPVILSLEMKVLFRLIEEISAQNQQPANQKTLSTCVESVLVTVGVEGFEPSHV